MSVQTIRVSVAGINRIRSPDGNYALLVNRATRRRSGIDVFTPIGGALHAYKTSRGFLVEDLGAHDFESWPDLRFRLPVCNLGRLFRWLMGNNGFEFSATREFMEELVDEARVLTTSDVFSLPQPTFAGYCTAQTSSGRANGASTQLVSLVWDVELTKTAMAKFIAASGGSKPLIGFFSKKQIMAGEGPNGAIIGNPISSFLTRPAQSLVCV